LEFPDSTTFFVQALTAKGSDDALLTIDKESFPGLVYAPQSTFVRQKTIDELIENNVSFISKAERRTKYEEEMWTITLKQVEVSAPVIKKKEPRDDYWMNLSSDYTIIRETIETFKFVTFIQYLNMIPNVNAIDNGIEGIDVFIKTMGRVGPALLYIDGFETDSKIFSFLYPEIVESIDVIKGPGSSLFGVRGAGGVISVTTRRGGDPGPEKQNRVVHSPLGYQKPVEFYAPKYETLAARQSPIPDYRTTIFWKPDVVISDDGEARFEFYSSDYPTTYSVVIEGLTSDGKIVRQVEKITVSGQ
jgi:hypothetical protein